MVIVITVTIRRQNREEDGDMNHDKEENLVEIIELFDDEGRSMLFELLTTIEVDNVDYFLLTSYDENEEFTDTPADVFIMQQVERNGEKLLEPLNDRTLINKVFSIFKDMSEDYDFVD